MTVAEHRPQYAWRRQGVFVAAHGANVPNCRTEHLSTQPSPGLLDEIQRNVSLILRRPLWLLQEPKLLRIEQNLPADDPPVRSTYTLELAGTTT